MSLVSRRTLLAAGAGLAGTAFAPAGLRVPVLAEDPRRRLWRREGGPKLRGAVFVERRVYPALDGPTFLGPGAVGPPVSDAALDALADSGANLASWSGPGPFAETAPFAPDPVIEDHIAAWLDRCAARGLFTTLCFRSGPGRSAFAFHPGETWYPADLYDASLWRDTEKQAAWAAMIAWTQARFGAHPALAGVLAMDEPNGIDLGYPSAWLELARAIAADPSSARTGAPLLLSPDRWARLEVADALRRAVGPEPVIVTHDYSPWEYTHPGDGQDIAFDPDNAAPPPPRELGAAAVLEFGARRGAQDLAGYLRHRISAYEGAGLNWAVFRWTSGWPDYEAVEGRRALDQDWVAAAILRAGFEANTVKPGQL